MATSLASESTEKTKKFTTESTEILNLTLKGLTFFSVYVYCLPMPAVCGETPFFQGSQRIGSALLLYTQSSQTSTTGKDRVRFSFKARFYGWRAPAAHSNCINPHPPAPLLQKFLEEGE